MGQIDRGTPQVGVKFKVVAFWDDANFLLLERPLGKNSEIPRHTASSSLTLRLTIGVLKSTRPLQAQAVSLNCRDSESFACP